MDIRVSFETEQFKFRYEGPEEYLEDRIMAFAKSMLELADEYGKGDTMVAAPEIVPLDTPNLAQYLSELKPRTQVATFLAAAAWLQAQGNALISTSTVIAALRNSKQQKLSNASDCLQKNIQQGYCERRDPTARTFFVTQTGLKSVRAGRLLGYPAAG